MIKSTILVVDRERILVDLLARALTSDEASALGATSCDEARTLMAKHNPALAIVDASLPDAFRFLEESIKNKVSVVAISASPEDSTRLERGGIGAVVDRQAGLDVLVGAIRRLHAVPLKLLSGNGGVRVLVTDDEDELRNVVAEFLALKGYDVQTSRNGFEAVIKIDKDPGIEVVLLDVNMPYMGGMEALRRIMAHNNPPTVIMMTAVTDREVARQAMNAGASDYILKPFDFASIDASIVACLAQRDAEEEPWWKRLARRVYTS
jgi:DNA-binding response OmpR family regulator